MIDWTWKLAASASRLAATLAEESSTATDTNAWILFIAAVSAAACAAPSVKVVETVGLIDEIDASAFNASKLATMLATVTSPFRADRTGSA